MSFQRSIATLALLIVVSVAVSALPPGGITKLNCTRPNEFYDCGSACQTECATLGEICPIVNIRCNDACYCIEGYVRDANNVCIPQCECAPKL